MTEHGEIETVVTPAGIVATSTCNNDDNDGLARSANSWAVECAKLQALLAEERVKVSTAQSLVRQRDAAVKHLEAEAVELRRCLDEALQGTPWRNVEASKNLEEVAAAKCQAEALTTQLKQSTQEMILFRGKLERLERQRGVLEEELESNRKFTRQLQEQLVTRDAVEKELRWKVSGLEKVVKKWEEDYVRVESTLRDQEQQIDTLQKERKRMEHEAAQHALRKRQLDDAQVSIEKLKARLLEQAYVDPELKAEVRACRQRDSQATETARKLKETKTAHDDLWKKLEDAKLAIRRLHADRETAEHGWRSKLEVADAEIRRLETSIGRLQDEVAQQKEAKAALQSELEKVKLRRGEFQTTVRDLDDLKLTAQKQRQAAEHEIESLRSQLQEARQAATDSHEHVSSLNAIIDKLEEERFVLRAESARLNGDLTAIQRQLQAARKCEAEMAAERQNFRQRWAQLKAAYTSEAAAASALRLEVEQWESRERSLRHREKSVTARLAKLGDGLMCTQGSDDGRFDGSVTTETPSRADESMTAPVSPSENASMLENGVTPKGKDHTRATVLVARLQQEVEEWSMQYRSLQQETLAERLGASRQQAELEEQLRQLRSKLSHSTRGHDSFALDDRKTTVVFINDEDESSDNLEESMAQVAQIAKEIVDRTAQEQSLVGIPSNDAKPTVLDMGMMKAAVSASDQGMRHSLGNELVLLEMQEESQRMGLQLEEMKSWMALQPTGTPKDPPGAPDNSTSASATENSSQLLEHLVKEALADLKLERDYWQQHAASCEVIILDSQADSLGRKLALEETKCWMELQLLWAQQCSQVSVARSHSNEPCTPPQPPPTAAEAPAIPRCDTLSSRLMSERDFWQQRARGQEVALMDSEEDCERMAVELEEVKHWLQLQNKMAQEEHQQEVGRILSDTEGHGDSTTHVHTVDDRLQEQAADNAMALAESQEECQRMSLALEESSDWSDLRVHALEVDMMQLQGKPQSAHQCHIDGVDANVATPESEAPNQDEAVLLKAELDFWQQYARGREITLLDKEEDCQRTAVELEEVRNWGQLQQLVAQANHQDAISKLDGDGGTKRRCSTAVTRMDASQGVPSIIIEMEHDEWLQRAMRSDRALMDSQEARCRISLELEEARYWGQYQKDFAQAQHGIVFARLHTVWGVEQQIRDAKADEVLSIRMECDFWQQRAVCHELAMLEGAEERQRTVMVLEEARDLALLILEPHRHRLHTQVLRDDLQTECPGVSPGAVPTIAAMAQACAHLAWQSDLCAKDAALIEMDMLHVQEDRQRVALGAEEAVAWTELQQDWERGCHRLVVLQLQCHLKAQQLMTQAMMSGKTNLIDPGALGGPTRAYSSQAISNEGSDAPSYRELYDKQPANSSANATATYIDVLIACSGTSKPSDPSDAVPVEGDVPPPKGHPGSQAAPQRNAGGGDGPLGSTASTSKVQEMTTLSDLQVQQPMCVSSMAAKVGQRSRSQEPPVKNSSPGHRPCLPPLNQGLSHSCSLPLPSTKASQSPPATSPIPTSPQNPLLTSLKLCGFRAWRLGKALDLVASFPSLSASFDSSMVARDPTVNAEEIVRPTPPDDTPGQLKSPSNGITENWCSTLQPSERYSWQAYADAQRSPLPTCPQLTSPTTPPQSPAINLPSSLGPIIAELHHALQVIHQEKEYLERQQMMWVAESAQWERERVLWRRQLEEAQQREDALHAMLGNVQQKSLAPQVGSQSNATNPPTGELWERLQGAETERQHLIGVQMQLVQERDHLRHQLELLGKNTENQRQADSAALAAAAQQRAFLADRLQQLQQEQQIMAGEQRNELNVLRTAVATLTEQKGMLELQIDALTHSNATLSAAIGHMETDAMRQSAALAEADSRIVKEREEAARHIAEVTAEAERIAHRAEEMRQEVETLRQEVLNSQLEAQRRSAELMRDNAQETLASTLQATCKNLTTRMAELQEEKRTLEVTNLQQLQHYAETKQAQEQEIAQLQAEITALNAQSAHWEADMASYRALLEETQMLRSHCSVVERQGVELTWEAGWQATMQQEEWQRHALALRMAHGAMAITQRALHIRCEMLAQENKDLHQALDEQEPSRQLALQQLQGFQLEHARQCELLRQLIMQLQTDQNSGDMQWLQDACGAAGRAIQREEHLAWDLLLADERSSALVIEKARVELQCRAETAQLIQEITGLTGEVGRLRSERPPSDTVNSVAQLRQEVHSLREGGSAASSPSAEQGVSESQRLLEEVNRWRQRAEELEIQLAQHLHATQCSPDLVLDDVSSRGSADASHCIPPDPSTPNSNATSSTPQAKGTTDGCLSPEATVNGPTHTDDGPCSSLIGLQPRKWQPRDWDLDSQRNSTIAHIMARRLSEKERPRLLSSHEMARRTVSEGGIRQLPPVMVYSTSTLVRSRGYLGECSSELPAGLWPSTGPLSPIYRTEWVSLASICLPLGLLVSAWAQFLHQEKAFAKEQWAGLSSSPQPFKADSRAGLRDFWGFLAVHLYRALQLKQEGVDLPEWVLFCTQQAWGSRRVWE